MIIHSRNVKHTEQVFEIDEAISLWENEYKEDVKGWQPTLVNGKSEDLQLEEINNPDFHSEFRDLDPYEVVKYHIDNIKDFVVDEDTHVIENKQNGEFNITSNLIVNFKDGQTLSLPNIPFYVKKKSPRSQKVCHTGGTGIWNTTDHSCYVFNQVTHL